MTNDRWDWAGIEDAYVNGDMSLRRISTAFGLSEWTLTKRANEQGWVRLVGTKALPRGRRSNPPGTPPAKRPTAEETHRRRTITRLRDALDRGLAELEARMSGDGEGGVAARSAADAERDARTLTALTRLYAKLVELDEQARSAKAAKTEGSAKPEATENADRFRGDLARRLELLNRPRDA